MTKLTFTNTPHYLLFDSEYEAVVELARQAALGVEASIEEAR